MGDAVSTVVVHLPPKPPEAVPAWPDESWKISDFAIGAIAARKQIEHLIEFACVIAKLRNFDESQTNIMKQWAEDFFRPNCPTPDVDAVVANAIEEVCYAHLGVRLHGHSFHAELVRMKAKQ